MSQTANQLATRAPANGTDLPAVGANPIAQRTFSLDDLWHLAEWVAQSQMFPGVRMPQQAMTLMLICEADQIHPINALRRYHIIDGHPTMRADAIQAEFQRRGGRIKIIKTDAIEARAVFSHPTYQPEGVTLEVHIDQFKHLAGRDNWVKNRQDMLWARLITKGVRKVDPGVIVGILSTDEAQDAIETAYVQAVIAPEVVPDPVKYVEPRLRGFDRPGLDDRPYHQVVSDEAAIFAKEVGPGVEVPPQFKPPWLHGQLALRAINIGYSDAGAPQKVAQAIAIMDKVYGNQRAWVRTTLSQILQEETIKFFGEPVDAEESQEARESTDRPEPDQARSVEPEKAAEEPKSETKADTRPLLDRLEEFMIRLERAKCYRRAVLGRLGASTRSAVTEEMLAEGLRLEAEAIKEGWQLPKVFAAPTGSRAAEKKREPEETEEREPGEDG